MFTKDPNDCKIPKRKLNQLQLLYVGGKTKTYFAHMSDYRGTDRNEFSRYLNELPERTVEEVLKMIQEERGERNYAIREQDRIQGYRERGDLSKS